jgi:hypothetical protein
MGAVAFCKVRIRRPAIASKSKFPRAYGMVIVALLPLFLLDSKRYSLFALH